VTSHSVGQAPVELFVVSSWPEYVRQLLHTRTSEHAARALLPVYLTSGASLPAWLPLAPPARTPPPAEERPRDAGSMAGRVYDAVRAGCGESAPDHLVIACGEPELAVVAAFLAGATGRRFEQVGNPAQLAAVARRAAAETVLVVCGVAQAEHPWLSEPALEPLPPIGVIPARTPAEASLAVCKTLAASSHPGRGSLHVNCLSASTVPVHDDAAVWTRRQLHPAAVESLTTTVSPWQLLLLDAHGHADRLFLGDATLRADGTEPDFGGLRAGIVFANTCVGAQLAPGGPDASRRLGLRAMAGWPYAYVSTLTVKDNSTIESELFEALLRTGRPLGQAVRTVNAYLREAGIDQPCFVLFGDPMATLPDSSPAPAPGVEWRAAGDGELRADVPLDGSRPVEIRLPEAARAGSGRILPAPGEAARTVRCAILPDRAAGASALLWSGSPGGSGVGMALTDRPVRLPLGGAPGGLPGRLAALSACGLNLQPVRGPVAQLESEIVRMARLASRAGYDLDSARELDDRSRSAERLLASVQVTLVEACCQRPLSGSLQFTERYRDAFRLDEMAPSPLRCACGLRLLRQMLRHQADPAIRRAVDVCPACGVVADSPADLDPVRLSAATGAAGPEAAIVLRWRPPRGSSGHLTAGVVGGAREDGRSPWRARPELATARVAGDVEVAFHRPHADSAVAGGRLTGFALVDLQLLFFARAAPGGGAG
jgi:hypothetical protein